MLVVLTAFVVASCGTIHEVEQASVGTEEEVEVEVGTDEAETRAGSYYNETYPSAATLTGSRYTQTQANASCSQAWEYFKSELVNEFGAVVRSDDGNVVSEGQSYGLMLAVQNNDQETFDKIWNWTRTYMQDGQAEGLFAWKCSADGTKLEPSTAPDAEEMIAMALFFASRRWGNKLEPYDYSIQAKDILAKILTHEVTADNYLAFSPYEMTWFNPSYQMPAFYRLFAIYTGEERWNTIADNSYNLILSCLKSSYGNTENGLVPDYCDKDGNVFDHHQYFHYDAMRVPWFIALDQVWFADEARAEPYLNKIMSFFGSKYTDFGDKYELDGSEISGNHVTSWMGSLAGGTMGATNEAHQVDFFNQLMESGWPTGQYRYYDICWLNFGLLLSTGNFRIY